MPVSPELLTWTAAAISPSAQVSGGVLDWDYAGCGPGGIDLGTLRLDATVMFGAAAADQVRAGWEEQAGYPAGDLCRWDLMAAMCSPPDLTMWLPNFAAQGRADLTLDTVTGRRNTFLAAALGRLGVS